MKSMKLRKFLGITPKLGRKQPVDNRSGSARAQRADNLNIDDGTIAPAYLNEHIEVRATGDNSVVKFDDVWYSGQNRQYLDTVYNGIPILYYLDGGVLKKRIGSDVADVGQPLPNRPTILDQAPGSLPLNTYQYVVTTVRDIGSQYYPRDDIADTEDDWTNKIVSESDVDYESFPPISGKVVLAENSAASRVVQIKPKRIEVYGATTTTFPDHDQDVGGMDLFDFEAPGPRCAGDTPDGWTLSDTYPTSVIWPPDIEFFGTTEEAVGLIDMDYGSSQFPADIGANNVDIGLIDPTSRGQGYALTYTASGGTYYVDYTYASMFMGGGYIGVSPEDFSAIVPENLAIKRLCIWAHVGANGSPTYPSRPSRPYIRVSGSVYQPTSYLWPMPLWSTFNTGPGTAHSWSYRTFYYEWDKNPQTNSDWTYADLWNINDFGVEFQSQGMGFTGYVVYGLGSCSLIVETAEFQPSGQFVVGMDINGASGGPAVTFGLNHDALPAGASVTVTGEGSNNDTFPGTALAQNPLTDQEVIDVYNYYQFTISLSSSDTLQTPAINTVSVTQQGDPALQSDESGPSEVSNEEAVPADRLIRITPNPLDLQAPYVSRWRVYRTDLDTGVFQFVAELPNTTLFYDDDGTVALGDQTPTWYTSDQGLIIKIGPPPTDLDGISSAFHAGILFAYKGRDIYWCDPGAPDWWPEIFTFKFEYDIKHAIPTAGAVGVLTEGGSFRLDGTHPELLQYSKSLGPEPCTGPAVETSRGIAYQSDSGIVIFNLVANEMLTDETFDEEYFVGIDGALSVMEYNDNSLILSHPNGSLVAKFSGNSVEWTTRGQRLFALWREEASGILYALDGGGIVSFETGNAGKFWTWESGDLAEGARRKYHSIEVIGAGLVDITISVNETLVSSKALDFTTERGRIALLPKGTTGERLTFTLSGTGTVESVKLAYA